MLVSEVEERKACVHCQILFIVITGD